MIVIDCRLPEQGPSEGAKMYIVTASVNALSAWSEQLADVRKRLPIAVAFRDRQVATRDRKNQQIPLTDHELRYWQKRIDEAQAVVDALTERLNGVNEEGPSAQGERA